MDKNWGDREVRAMLHIINKKYAKQLVNGGNKRNKPIFQDISNELKKKNIVKCDWQIRSKYKTLKADFLKAKRNNSLNGAHRQTVEHYDLLDELFRHSLVVEAVGVDLTEMVVGDFVAGYDEDDIPDVKISVGEYNLQDMDLFAQSVQPAEQDTVKVNNKPQDDGVRNVEFATNSKTSKRSKVTNGSQDEFSDEEAPASTNNLRTYSRAKKQSYQKVVEYFTQEWRDSQKVLLDTLKKQEEKMIDKQSKKQEEMLNKNMQALEKILEKDREENAKMFQAFLNAIQPMQAMPLFGESASTSAFCVPVPKESPKSNDESA